LGSSSCRVALQLAPRAAANAGLDLIATRAQRTFCAPAEPATLQTSVALKLPVDSRSLILQDLDGLDDLALAMSGFGRNVKLLSPLLGKLRVATHMRSSYFGR
jgi:hypothetical protein